MAGLDTRGLADGFLQGFQVMDRHQQRKEHSRRADEQMEMQRQNQAMREGEHQWRSQDRQHQDQARTKAQDTEMLGQFWGAFGQGMTPPVTPELEQAFERNPYLSPKFLFDPSKEESAAYAERLAKGEGDLYSPETLQHVNNFFEPDINKGGGKKKLAGLFPGREPGTFVFDLEVEGDDGQKYNAPMTPNHSADDDEILQLPVDKLINPIMGYKQLMGSMSPEVKQKAIGYFQSIGLIKPPVEQWEQVQGPGGSVLQRNARTGELKQVIGRESRAGMGRADGSTTQQDNFHFLRGSLGMSDDQAYQAAFGGTGAVNGKVPDQVKVGLNLLGDQIKEYGAQLDGKAGLMLSDEVRDRLAGERARLVAQRNSLAESVGLIGAPPTQQTSGVPGQADGAGPVPAGTKAEYDALPPGAVFLAPDGQVRRKPG